VTASAVFSFLFRECVASEHYLELQPLCTLFLGCVSSAAGGVADRCLDSPNIPEFVMDVLTITVIGSGARNQPNPFLA